MFPQLTSIRPKALDLDKKATGQPCEGHGGEDCPNSHSTPASLQLIFGQNRPAQPFPGI